MKRLRRLPIVVTEYGRPQDHVFPFLAEWKRAWLGHWLSLAFRGRVTSAAYGRLHGVGNTSVLWLIRAGRLGSVTRDTSGRYWVRSDWPYPAAVYRAGGHQKRGGDDSSVRALHYSDFVMHGKRCQSEVLLETYCRSMWIHGRKTLEDAQEQAG